MHDTESIEFTAIAIPPTDTMFVVEIPNGALMTESGFPIVTESGYFMVAEDANL